MKTFESILTTNLSSTEALWDPNASDKPGVRCSRCCLGLKWELAFFFWFILTIKWCATLDYFCVRIISQNPRWYSVACGGKSVVAYFNASELWSPKWHPSRFHSFTCKCGALLAWFQTIIIVSMVTVQAMYLKMSQSCANVKCHHTWELI